MNEGELERERERELERESITTDWQEDL